MIPLLAAIPAPPPAAFEAAVALVIQWEGGGEITDSSTDRGGLTRWGISKRAHPDLDVAELTRERAIEVYRERYWRVVRADEMPPALALVVMDFAVHSGPDTAIRWLQRALKVEVDGVMGPVTLAACRAARWCLAERLIAMRLGRIQAIADSDAAQMANLEGWRMRVLRCHRAAVQWAREAAL